MPDGSKHRASVARKIRDDDAANHQKIRFLIEIGTEGELDEIIAYNELSNIIEHQHNCELNNPDMPCAFQAINKHLGPINQSNPRYIGSDYNALFHLEDGAVTLEPGSVMAKACDILTRPSP
mgnify:CR=1 FL=1